MHSSAVVTALPPFGIQSGVDDGASSGSGSFRGSSFAGDMVYDANTDVVFVTGATYSSFFDINGDTSSTESTASSCFLSIITIPTTKENSPAFVYNERFGDGDAVESCSTLTNFGSKLYIGGQAEKGGLLTSLRPEGSSTSLQYANIIDFDVDLNAETQTTTSLLGGRLVHRTDVQSTKSMVLDPSGEIIFVVSQSSDLNGVNTDFDAMEPEPNLVDNSKWGGNYYLQVMKFAHKVEQSKPSSTPAITFSGALWAKEIATVQNPVDVAGIALIASSSLLLVAGSAIGFNGKSIPATNTNKWAGFVTLFNATEGTLKDAIGIDTQENKITRVEGICSHPSNEDEIYLVGSTNGNLDLPSHEGEELTAFVMRVVTSPALSLSWVTQVEVKDSESMSSSGPAEITGYACAVTEDGGVYVGGVVKNGAAVNNENHISAGKDDIWVGFIDSDSISHEFKWTRQLGTPENEHLSALQVDADGDVLVLGNSNGSFMRRKNTGDTSTDIFLLRLTKLTGEFPVPKSDTFPDTDDVYNSQPTQFPTSGVDVTTPTNDSGGGGGHSGSIAVVVVLIVILGTVACFLYQRRHQGRHADTDSSHIECYVGSFHDVEVDLKHSATGGWHGTYVDHDGDPEMYSRRGGIMDDNDDFITFSGGEMSSLTHAAIVQDSLFSLDDDEPDLGRGALGRNSFHSRQSSYRGLVDVYNNYDLSHHRLPSATPRAMVDVNINDDEQESRSARARWGREII